MTNSINDNEHKQTVTNKSNEAYLKYKTTVVWKFPGSGKKFDITSLKWVKNRNYSTKYYAPALLTARDLVCTESIVYTTTVYTVDL